MNPDDLGAQHPRPYGGAFDDLIRTNAEAWKVYLSGQFDGLQHGRQDGVRDFLEGLFTRVGAVKPDGEIRDMVQVYRVYNPDLFDHETGYRLFGDKYDDLIQTYHRARAVYLTGYEDGLVVAREYASYRMMEKLISQEYEPKLKHDMKPVIQGMEVDKCREEYRQKWFGGEGR
ncbi:hypothetical protein [Auritidibacter ignavus]|nr:hypothetical protein [Auritidibacter ignavus]WHS35211.1 hypothetical protein QM403_01210 [Auritidibacter ignavus]